jgi:hypothetical protein
VGGDGAVQLFGGFAAVEVVAQRPELNGPQPEQCARGDLRLGISRAQAGAPGEDFGSDGGQPLSRVSLISLQRGSGADQRAEAPELFDGPVPVLLRGQP